MLLIDTVHTYYRIVRRIAQGTIGAAYQARDTRNGDLVAIKHIPASDSARCDQHAIAPK